MAIFHHPFTDVENCPLVSPLSLIISFKYPDQGSPPTLGGKGKRYSLKDYKRLNAWYWKANVKEIEFQKMLSSPHRKNKMSKNKTKTLKKGTKRIGESKKKWWKMRDEWKDNEKWSFMKWSLVWSPWNTVWAYLSFLSVTRTLAYITYLKIHFDWTWILGLESFLPWENFHNQQGCCLFSPANKKSWSVFHWFGMNFELSSA